MKRIISTMLILTFVFQFNTITVLAEELNKREVSNVSDEINTQIEESILTSLTFNKETLKV